MAKGTVQNLNLFCTIAGNVDTLAQGKLVCYSQDNVSG